MPPAEPDELEQELDDDVPESVKQYLPKSLNEKHLILAKLLAIGMSMADCAKIVGL